MKIGLIATLLVSGLFVLTRTRPLEGRFGGTFIGAIICEDGIVMASDSRSTFEDEARAPVGYVDGMTKIFVQNGAAFAVSGLTSVGADLFPSFVKRNQFLLDRPVNELLFGVSLWLPFQNSTNVLLISAGYLDGEPLICARAPNSPQMCRKDGFVANRESSKLMSWFLAHRRDPKTAEAVDALKDAISENEADDRTIGGPVSVLRLQESASPVWVENPPADNGWSKVCDLVADYRRGRLPIGFRNSKEELDRYLMRICPASR